MSTKVIGDWRQSGIALAFGVFSISAGAQPVTPGSVQDTLRKPNTPVSVPEPLAPSDSQPLRKSPVPADAPKVTVNTFLLSGNTLFGTEQLQPLLVPYVGRPITLVELYEAADAITRFYVDRGYTLASTAVPAQNVDKGEVQLEVLEGRIGEVRYEGLRRYRPSLLDVVLGNHASKVYRATDVEQSLRTADAFPGLDVRARLQPGADYGNTDIVVQAKETALDGSLFVDNAGTANIGVIRMGGQLSLNNPLGVADRVSLSALRSREGLLKYGALAYSVPTWVGDSRLNASYSLAKFDVAGAFNGVSGKNRVARIELFMPITNTVNQQFNLTVALNDTRANTDFNGTRFNLNEVTVMEIGAVFTKAFEVIGVSQLSISSSSNFQKYNAITDTASVPLKLDLDAQHLAPLAYGVQLLARAQGVYGLDPLPDTQKYSLGGPDSVRGYAPTEARGDWGYLGQLALQRPIFWGSVSITPRAYYDFGEVRQHQADRFPAGSQPQDVQLSSYGAGGDIEYRGLNFRFDYAIPTSNTPVSDGKEDGRFYGALSFSF